MDVPKFKGFKDSKTPYDYIVELVKYQSIMGYSDDFMLDRILPMSLNDEASNWFRTSLHPFQSLLKFQHRLRREYQPMGYKEDLLKEMDNRT